jgi:hypothetical protein
MLKEIIKECIKDMIKDPMLLLTFDPNEPFDIKSYTLKTLGKGAVYSCETDVTSPIRGDGVFYVEQSRVNKKIEEKRNKRIDYVLNRQSEI